MSACSCGFGQWGGAAGTNGIRRAPLNKPMFRRRELDAPDAFEEAARHSYERLAATFAKRNDLEVQAALQGVAAADAAPGFLYGVLVDKDNSDKVARIDPPGCTPAWLTNCRSARSSATLSIARSMGMLHSAASFRNCAIGSSRSSFRTAPNG